MILVVNCNCRHVLIFSEQFRYIKYLIIRMRKLISASGNIK